LTPQPKTKLKMKKLFLMFLITGFIVAFTSCGGGSSTEAETEAETEEPAATEEEGTESEATEEPDSTATEEADSTAT